MWTCVGFMGLGGFIVVLHGIRGSLRLWALKPERVGAPVHVDLWLGLPAEWLCIWNAECKRVVGGCEYGAIGVERLGEDSPGVGATLLSLSVEVHVQVW